MSWALVGRARTEDEAAKGGTGYDVYFLVALHLAPVVPVVVRLVFGTISAIVMLVAAVLKSGADAIAYPELAVKQHSVKPGTIDKAARLPVQDALPTHDDDMLLAADSGDADADIMLLERRMKALQVAIAKKKTTRKKAAAREHGADAKDTEGATGAVGAAGAKTSLLSVATLASTAKKVRRKTALRRTFTALDTGHTGHLTLGAFLAACEGDDEATLRRLFSLLDEDGSGTLEEGELVHALRHNKEAMALADELVHVHALLDAANAGSKRKKKKKRAPTVKARARHTVVKERSKLKAQLGKLNAAFGALGPSGNGQLSLDQFLAACRVVAGDDEGRRDATALFQLLDEDGSGGLECAELAHALKTNAEAAALARKFAGLRQLVRLATARAKRKQTMQALPIAKDAGGGGGEAAALAAALTASMSDNDKQRHGLAAAAGPRTGPAVGTGSVPLSAKKRTPAVVIRPSNNAALASARRRRSRRRSTTKLTKVDEDPPRAGSTPPPPKDHKEALVRLYTRCDPAKLNNVDKILTKFKGNPDEMYRVLGQLFPGEAIERANYSATEDDDEITIIGFDDD